MELSIYLDILRRRLLVILTVTFVAITVIALKLYLTTPIYQAYATVRVMEDVGIKDFSALYNSYERLANTYGEIVQSWPILDEVLSQVDIDTSLVELSQQIEVEPIPNTELVKIVVFNKDPVLARDIANTLAKLLVAHVKNFFLGENASSRQVEEQLNELNHQLEQDRDRLAQLSLDLTIPEEEIEKLENEIAFKENSFNRMLSLYDSTRISDQLRANSIRVVALAQLPSMAANSGGVKEIGLGMLVGLFSGIALALILENLDTRIYNRQQLEALSNVPLLGIVPRGTLSSQDLNTNEFNPNYKLPEAYRLLVINLQALKNQSAFQTIAITSAVGGEGKSTVSVNLAQVFAERGQTVFLIESDMRRPSLGKKLGFTETELTGEGLSDLLSDPGILEEVKLSQVLNITDQPTLYFVEGGSTVANPTALLSSPRMNELLNFFGAQGQVTIIDTPPILGMADVSVLASKVDGFILVVTQGASHQENLQAALRQLDAAQANIIGTVFIQPENGRSTYK